MFTTIARIDTARISALILLVLAALGGVLPHRELFVLTVAFGYGLAALGTDLCSGYAGQPNIGQGVFVAVGAFTTAILAQGSVHLPLLLVMAISAGLAAVGAAIVGLAAARLRHLGFAVVTFMLAYVGFTLLTGKMLHRLTNDRGGYQVTPSKVLGIVDLSSPRAMYGFALALLMLVTWLTHNYVNSRAGRALMTIKENEAVAEVLGVSCYTSKICAYAYSAAIAAVGGSILAEATGYVSPDSFDPLLSVFIFGMAVIGGLGTVAGAIIGAIFFRLIPEFSQSLGQYNQLLFATLFLGVLILLPGGFLDLTAPLARAGRRTIRIAGRGARRDVHEDLPSSLGPAAPDRDLPVPRVRPAPTGPAAGEECLLAVRALTVQFAGVRALDEVNLSVRRGTCHAVVGPNGAGKTTLLNCLTGLVPSASGAVALGGSDLGRSGARARRRLGFGRTFQHPSLVPDLDVIHNVMVGVPAPSRWSSANAPLPRWLRARSDRRCEAAAVAALDLVSFPVERRRVRATDLSYGEQKLADLARVLVGEPSVLLLDEPTSGLSFVDLPNVMKVLARLRRERNMTMILVSHDVAFVADLADDVTVLVYGEVLTTGHPTSVLDDTRVQDVFIGASQ